MGKAKVWYENDRLWDDLAPILFDQERWLNTPEEVDQVIALASPEEGCRVVDVCCGPGRHSLEFARRGFQVTGVDRTKNYIQEARRRAREEKLKIEFVVEDARRFKRAGVFDLALNLYTAFGYFEDPADQQRMLRNICASLKRGGALVMDLMSKEVLARIFCERRWREIDGIILIEERKLLNNWSEIENRCILLNGDRRYEYSFRHWLYSAAELGALLKESGFKTVEFYGGMSGEPYDQNATHMVAVARK